MESFFPHLLSFLNDIYRRKETPPCMRETAFAMIPKPGCDLRDPANRRYVALMSYMAKLYDLLLRARIRSVIDPLLRFNQNGFRQGRNTQQHIMSLEFIMNAFRQQKKSSSIYFCRLQKCLSFCSVVRYLSSTQIFLCPGSTVKCHSVFVSWSSGFCAHSGRGYRKVPY